jgi:serine protease
MSTARGAVQWSPWLAALVRVLIAVLALALGMTGAGARGSAAASAAGRVDARNLGSGGLERVVVRWRNGAQRVPRAHRTERLAAALPGLRHAAELGGDATAYWLPAASTRAWALADLHALAAVSGVAEVVPDVHVTADLSPDDPYFVGNSQLDLSGTYGIDAPPAWDITTGSGSVVVAVIDTGITSHSELSARVLPGYDFISDAAVANDGNGRDADASDPGDWVTSAESASGYFEGCPAESSSWHGTHVAGTIGAAGNNGVGVAGIAWSTSILPVRVLGKCGGYLSDIVAAIRWAAGGSVPGVPDNPNPARVLNLSLGGPGTCDDTTQQAVDDAIELGATVVVAAGNSNDDATAYSPASCDGVISVAATTSAGKRASFSNYGTGVTIAAPGTGIWSTWNAGATSPGTETYQAMSGTSMAAPHVAGVAALVLAVEPDLTPADVRALLVDHARPFAADVSGSSCQSLGCGAGIVDAGASVAAAQTGPPADTTPPAVTAFAPVTPSPTHDATVSFSLRFSEAVTGLTAGDLWMPGTANGCVIGAPTGSGKTYAIGVTGCSEGTVSLALAAGSLTDAAGNAGPTGPASTAGVVVDRTAPTATAPVLSIRAGGRLSGSAIPIALTWSGSDGGGSGVARYDVGRSTDGGTAWSTVALGLTAATFTTSVASSGSVRFRVRAIDRAGNAGAWAEGPAIRPRLIQQTRPIVHYRGTWHTSRADSYSGGSVRYATAANAWAKLTTTARSIALVTTRAPRRGKVRIYLDGTRVKTIDLRRSSGQTRSVVWQRTWTTAATHTIRIVVVGTAGRPRVDLDAFAFLR